MVVEIAAVVGIHKLNDSIQAIKNLIRRMGKPKMMVLIAEQSISNDRPGDVACDAHKWD